MTTPRARYHGALRAAALSLLAGLLITIAIAWYSAAFVDFSKGVANHDIYWDKDLALVVGEIHATTKRPRGATGVRNAWKVMKSYEATNACPFCPADRVLYRQRLYQTAGHTKPFSAPTSWRSPPPATPRTPLPAGTPSVADARGWPRLALSCQFSSTTNPDGTTRWTPHSGIPFPWTGGDTSLTIRALPYRPIWSGLAINTLIYATLFALVFLLPPAIRRALRRREGLCKRCGYDLRGLPTTATCPECGSAPASPS